MATSQILRVLSSEAEQMCLESADHAKSEMPSVCPSNGGSTGEASEDNQIRTVLSAEELASYFPSDENLTLEMALRWPVIVCLRVYGTYPLGVADAAAAAAAAAATAAAWVAGIAAAGTSTAVCFGRAASGAATAAGSPPVVGGTPAISPSWAMNHTELKESEVMIRPHTTDSSKN